MKSLIPIFILFSTVFCFGQQQVVVAYPIIDYLPSIVEVGDNYTIIKPSIEVKDKVVVVRPLPYETEYIIEVDRQVINRMTVDFIYSSLSFYIFVDGVWVPIELDAGQGFNFPCDTAYMLIRQSASSIRQEVRLLME